MAFGAGCPSIGTPHFRAEHGHGHLRHVRWVKGDDPRSQINNKPELKQNNKSAAQNSWIACKKDERPIRRRDHAAPEAFWVDKTKIETAVSILAERLIQAQKQIIAVAFNYHDKT